MYNTYLNLTILKQHKTGNQSDIDDINTTSEYFYNSVDCMVNKELTNIQKLSDKRHRNYHNSSDNEKTLDLENFNYEQLYCYIGADSDSK